MLPTPKNLPVFPTELLMAPDFIDYFQSGYELMEGPVKLSLCCNPHCRKGLARVLGD